MLVKLNTVAIVGASTAAVLALTGCGGDDDAELGTSCDVNDSNACGGDDNDLVCRDFDGDSYCTLPCEDGDLGACEQGEAGSSGDFECNAPEGGSGFCEKSQAPPPPSGGTQLGDACDPSDDGVCGQGQQGGSDFVCKSNPTTGENFCTLECSGAEGIVGECLSSANPPSGYECDADAGFCVPDGQGPPPPAQYKLGDSCNSALRGECGESSNPPSGFVCKSDPNDNNRDICTESCDPSALGTCGSSTFPSSGYECVGANADSAFCFKQVEEPDYKLGDECDLSAIGTCGTTANPPSGLTCERDPFNGKAYCTEPCDPNLDGACGATSNPPSGLECRNRRCFPKGIFGETQ